MLKQALFDLLGIELEYDPAIGTVSRLSILDIISARLRRDPQGRIRILFVDNVEDLSSGRFKDTDIIGFNMTRQKLIFVAIPPCVDPISDECVYTPGTMDGYLLAVTLHELYENLTGDVHHCQNPGKCLNSVCQVYDNGTCCVCMAGLIDEKWPNLRLEDLYCEEDLGELRRVLQQNA